MLVCPKCHSKLEDNRSSYKCSNQNCSQEYPGNQGIPILIDESNSVFTINSFLDNKLTTLNLKSHTRKQLVKKYLPSINRNFKAKQNYTKFKEELLRTNPKPKVLVLGGGILGSGFSVLLNSNIELVESDVAYGIRTQLICDGHSIPFEDNSFDGVVVQAVLEHVLDPHQVVREIYRVLKMDGLVFAETPFMQQVHMAPFDFTRFTFLGHRRLFRHFNEIESGTSLGPGAALAWSYMYFLLSFAKNKVLRNFLMLFAHLTAFWLKYFDFLLIKKSAAIDAACGVYFIGSKSEKTLSDQELVKLYRGAIS